MDREALQHSLDSLNLLFLGKSCARGSLPVPAPEEGRRRAFLCVRQSMRSAGEREILEHQGLFTAPHFSVSVQWGCGCQAIPAQPLQLGIAASGF